MLEPIREVSPGEPWRLNARRENALSRIAQREEASQVNKPSAGIPSSTTWPSLEVIVYNSTGADVAAGGILAITAALAEFPDYPREASEHPVVSGTTPTAVTNAVVVLSEPIATLTYGRAVLIGEAVCTIDVINANHLYAAPKPGVSSKLTSVPAGPIRILAKESGTGDKLAMVALQSLTPVWALVRCTSNTVTSSMQDGVVQVPNGEGTWSDSAAVKMMLSTSGGTKFRSGGAYPLVLNGFDSSTPIYSGLGSTSWEHPVCRSGETQTDRAWLYGFFEVETNV